MLFTRPDPPSSSCTYGVSVSIDFNGFATAHQGNDFTVSVGGDNLVPPNGANGSPNGVWRSSGFSNNDVAGRSDLMLSWTCKRQRWERQLPDPVAVPRQRHERGSAQPRSDVGDRAGACGLLGAPLQSFRAGTGPTLKTVYPTVGLDSSFYIGQKRVLRLPKCKTGNNDTNDCNLDSGSPNNSQSIDCEPGTGGRDTTSRCS